MDDGKARYSKRPYIKQYDAKGDLINPIVGDYLHSNSNQSMTRRQRRALMRRIKKLVNKNK